MTCPSCGAANPAGKRFCTECGTALALACPFCGAALTGGEKFCGECGTPLAAAAPTPVAVAAPAAERRLVTVLFADLVGFTTASEGRDAEETRELLSRYFETARTLIERYGGTVEKFIGDAVMAVWGTPVAQEDDAERAVRAALDLVAAVPELDGNLQARAGVLTGEAAVTLGAKGEGMVAGDLVNTASRIEAAAAPATVLVGETTKHVTEAAIAYEPAGTHELKGKTEPASLYRALRVTAHRGGAVKAAGLEPPFVGRERELRLVKELFHAAVDERTAHLVSIVGVGGMGKSRIVWEFEKYVDGLVENVRWHRGRCLAYGEGVTYWALAEMVRMRAGISEGEGRDPARAKLRSAVEEHVSDAEERAWIEPRLAQLLGLEERQVHEREDLFAGWRLFFERMAEIQPVALVFEDIHWADQSLLDFVEYVLEWSRDHRIFVLTLARPELLERHPQWGAGSRAFTSIALGPLTPQAMEQLLAGLVPGLADDLRARILERAEGVPLYAVETVRMLLDRGLLERAGDQYRVSGPIESLDVPQTLHALIATRLDGLEPMERRLIQDAAVLGKTFSTPPLAAVSGRPEDEIAPVLAGLVRKEILVLQIDPRSPERGQYAFLQDLIRHVAYETLGRRERKARHLAAAASLEQAFGPSEQEIVEVLAAHYLAAYEIAPEDPDAPAIRGSACEMLARAGERAASLAASEEAERYFSQAAGLTEDAIAEAELRERAGEMATAAGRYEPAAAHFKQAVELLEGQGESHPTARVLARLGWVEWLGGQLEDAIERMEGAFAVLSADEPDADFAALTAELGRLNFFGNHFERSSELLELAISLGETLQLPEVLAQALSTYGLVSTWRGHFETGFALTSHALKLALENDLPTPALRAYNNLGDSLTVRDRYEEALEYLESGIALARRVGNRQWELQLLLESSYPLGLTGRWDEAIERVGGMPGEMLGALGVPPLVPPQIHGARGEIAEARQFLSNLGRLHNSNDVQVRAVMAAIQATVLRAEGQISEALAAGEAAFDARLILAGHQCVKVGFVEAVEAAFDLGHLDKVDELLDAVEELRPGEVPPFMRAQAARFRARLGAARREHDGVERRFKGAESLFREFGIPFWLAVSELEHGEWLVSESRNEEARPLVDEARDIFERVGAMPWLQRVERVLPQAAVA